MTSYYRFYLRLPLSGGYDHFNRCMDHIFHTTHILSRQNSPFSHFNFKLPSYSCSILNQLRLTLTLLFPRIVLESDGGYQVNLLSNVSSFIRWGVKVDVHKE